MCTTTVHYFLMVFQTSKKTGVRADVVVKERADFGVAFDGDFDDAFYLIMKAILFGEPLWVFFLKCFKIRCKSCSRSPCYLEYGRYYI